MVVVFADRVEFRMGPTVISKVKKCIKENGMDRELGGILIGTQSTDGRIYEVTDITLSPKYGSRHRLSFVRSKRIANNQIYEAWNQSGGKENYLGEWHTHDELRPRMSGVDVRAMLHLAKSELYHFEKAFLLIPGNSERVAIAMIDFQEKSLIEEEGVFR